jgi:DNA-binding transcriptional LysR family regulator
MFTTDWPGLEIRHLAALQAVAETGNFSRAADRLGYTQSAVSQQVAALERIVGVPLFDRPGGPRPVTLTPAGDVMRTHAEAVLSRLRTAEADLRALSTGEIGTLRLGTIQSVGTNVLPGVLQRFRERWPGVEVALTEEQDYSTLEQLVMEGELDVCFTVVDERPKPGLESRLVLLDPFLVLVPSDSPEASRSSLSPDEIVTLPLVGACGDCQKLVEDRLSQQPNARLSYVFRSDDNGTMQNFVAAGLACAVTPALTLSLTPIPGVTLVAIDPPLPDRRVSIAWHSTRRRSPAVDGFIETAVEVGTEVQARLPRPLGAPELLDRATQ